METIYLKTINQSHNENLSVDMIIHDKNIIKKNSLWMTKWYSPTQQ